jgi:hypothetical protein
MARQAVVILLVVIAFGILVPFIKGLGMLDSRIIALYACLGLLFVAPASVEWAAGPGKAAPVRDIITRIAIIVGWGWGMTLVILGTAIVTMNLVGRRGGFAAPPFRFLAAVLTFSLTASIAVALLGAVLARRFSASQVKSILRGGFLVILIALVVLPRVLPEPVTLAVFERFSTRRALTQLAWEASAISAMIAALLLLVIMRRSRTQRPGVAST